MLHIPLYQIVEKIKSSSALSEDEIKQKIKEKVDQLSGLISEEGAAHIIANELGIKLFDYSGRLQIKNILPGMRSIEVLGAVQRVFETREFKNDQRSGKVGSFMISDETGSIRIVCWNTQADSIKDLKENDVVKIVSAYVKENNNGFKELHLNDKSRLIINPEGEKVEVKSLKNSTRKKIEELREGEANIEILGYITQSFDIRFFEICPKCNKRAKKTSEESYTCERCGLIKPDFNYVFNIILDDGSDSIRAVFFGKNVEELLEKKGADVIVFKENPASFDDVKHDLLGKLVKVVGYAKKNTLFDRLEFVVSNVITPDPEEELRRLEAEKEQQVIT